MGQRYESSVNYAFIFINFVRRMAEMLKIERAALRLGGRLLFRDLDMDVAAGQWVCVTGESGCGKTSLLRAVLGFLPLDSGWVSVCGEDLSLHTVERIRRRTAYVPQELFLPADTEKFSHKLLQRVTAFYDSVQKFQSFRTDLLHVVDIHTDQDVLDLVRHFVDIMAELRDVLSLDRRDERFDQHVIEFMPFFIRLPLDLMDLIKSLPDLIRIKIRQDLFQEMCRLA